VHIQIRYRGKEKGEIDMPRRARLDTPGTLHHVIVRGIEKRKIVDDDHDRNMFIERLGELSQSNQSPIYAWALITTHALC
jgi:putative transposase